jgi:hypothetical protein
MAGARKGTKGRPGTAPKPLDTDAGAPAAGAASGRLPAGEPWDPEEVGEIIAEKFRQEYHETEGPARIGPWRIWRCWTHDGKYYHAHYGVAPSDGRLLFFRDFQPFADWLKDAHAGEVDEARARGLADADAAAARAAADRRAEENAKAELHARRMEWVRVAVAAAIVLVLLALVFLQVGVRDREGFNVSHVISLLAGAGVAYLLGSWVRRKRPDTAGG